MYFVTFLAKNLLRRPVRTALTVLGLSVAVGSMVALLGISHNVAASVEQSFVKRGIDLVVTQAGKGSDLNSDFDQNLVDQARQIPGVVGVDDAVVDVFNLTRDTGRTDQVMLQGWRPDNAAFDDIEIVAGRKLQPGDNRKVMLGSTLAGNLGKGVGDTIRLGSDATYEVVGVYKSFVVFEDGAVTMTLDDSRELTGKKVTGFSVRVAKASPGSTAEVEAVKAAVEALRDPHDPSVRLTARTPDNYVDSVTHLKIVRALSWMVSAMGMLIGVIGMLNTMVMSVIERTQEIGILRAVGWPPGRVVRMILGEALLLGLAAAAVGTAGAVAASYALTRFPQVNGFIEGGIAPVVMAEGLGITLAIGLLGGLYPSIRAARLLPTEAIRHD
ncbi:MAG: ABC transporter permease [Gemmataceae bacterium]|nr:ABC transporter permease [Gemmataceae bacterium]